MAKSNLKEALIFGGLLTATLTLNAYAFDINNVPEGDKPFQAEFDSLNKNKDQTLSWSELKAGDSKVDHKAFKTFDRNHDGTLTYDEYADLKSHVSKQTIKTVASDSWITTKAKAKLLEEESLKSLKISVETHKGEVLLSGFVPDAALKAKAAEAVASIEGVKSVKNSIEVKS